MSVILKTIRNNKPINSLNPNCPNILLTVDVEDYFQVENFKSWIPYSSWDSYELRVEKNTNRLLDLFDSISFNDTTNPINPKATFFVLGWIAKRLPHLVRKIHDRGHEVASHGYLHKVCSQQSHLELKQDLSNSKKFLEDITGDHVFGYRAPSFSIDDDILKVIEDCGYLYDSSLNSFGMHGRYGQADLTQFEKKGIAIKISNNFYELSISNIKIGKTIFPWGGGAYFRLQPFVIFKIGVKQILNKDNGYLFYCHPWEFDPDQPRVREASLFFKFRHYVDLKNTYAKLARLISVFSNCRFITCSQYISEVTRKSK